jgi:hypothetical protein
MTRFTTLIAILAIAAIGGYNQLGEYLPSDTPTGLAKTDDCKLTSEVARVTLDADRYPETADHIQDAITAGAPAVMTIDRAGADQNREQSLRGIPTRDGHDRDEYPMAMSAEGGEGASVRHIPSADNRGAGSSVGSQLGAYCDGQRFTIKVG